MSQAIPLYAEDLIKKLDEIYPKRTPTPHDPIERIMFNAGQRSVVDVLLKHLEYQKEDQKMGED